jgi:pimeloyl-ACP methyl ester carboxylesterase
MMENNFETSQGKIYYQFIDKKSTTTLWLLHGFMEDHQVWHPIAPLLEANLIMVDLLGFGKSIPHAGFNFSMQQQAVSLLELWEFLQPRNCRIVGHSMGGYMALEMARIQTGIPIALLHSTCKPDAEERKINRNKTIEVLQKDPSIFIREFYWNLFAEHRKDEFAPMIEGLKKKAEKIPVHHIIQTIMALRDRKDHTHTWQTSVHNHVLIAGTYDKLLDVHELHQISTLAGTGWVELKNSGHMSFYEEPLALATALNAWVIG